MIDNAAAGIGQGGSSNDLVIKSGIVVGDADGPGRDAEHGHAIIEGSGVARVSGEDIEKTARSQLAGGDIADAGEENVVGCVRVKEVLGGDGTVGGIDQNEVDNAIAIGIDQNLEFDEEALGGSPGLGGGDAEV